MLFDAFVGRIHSAVISGVNLEAGSVTVEWFEKNEIKGKEACISFTAHFNNICVWLYMMLNKPGISNLCV